MMVLGVTFVSPLRYAEMSILTGVQAPPLGVGNCLDVPTNRHPCRRPWLRGFERALAIVLVNFAFNSGLT